VAKSTARLYRVCYAAAVDLNSESTFVSFSEVINGYYYFSAPRRTVELQLTRYVTLCLLFLPHGSRPFETKNLGERGQTCRPLSTGSSCGSTSQRGHSRRASRPVTEDICSVMELGRSVWACDLECVFVCVRVRQRERERERERETVSMWGLLLGWAFKKCKAGISRRTKDNRRIRRRSLSWQVYGIPRREEEFSIITTASDPLRGGGGWGLTHTPTPPVVCVCVCVCVCICVTSGFRALLHQ